MPEKRDPHDDPRFRRNEPNLSHSPDPESDEESAPTGFFQKIRNSEWVQENPILAKGLVVGLLAVVFLAVLGWQLGWFRAKPLVEEPASDQPPVPPVVATTPVPEPQPAVEPKPVEPKPEEKPQPQTPPPPPLPDDVGLWKRDDYFRARREAHPKLAEAIIFLGEMFHGSPDAAEGLTELLKRPEEPASPSAAMAPPPGNPAQRPTDTPRLMEIIVTALGANGSERAKTTLIDILSGKLATEDDKAAIPAVIKTLVNHPSPESDALLLKLLVAPETVRPENVPGPWTPTELRAKALECVKQGPTVELRTALAEVLTSRLTKLSPADPIGELLLAPDPMNCGAQMVLAANENISEELRTKLEQQLAGYSGAVLATLLKIPDGKQVGGFSPMAPAGGVPGVPASSLGIPGDSLEDLSSGLLPAGDVPTEGPISPVVKVANLLWSEKFRTPLEEHLQESLSLDKRPELTVLAGTIPQDTTRFSLNKLLRRRWSDGSKALEGAGLPDRVFLDPGFLVIAKMLPRKSSKSGSAVSRATPPGGKGSDAIPLAQRKEIAEQEWMAISGKLVAQWRARLQMGALAKKKHDEDVEAPPTPPKLPPDFVLNPNAKVIASYHFAWPLMATDGRMDPKPSFLEIHYIYAAETTKPRKAAAFYAGKAHVRLTDARPLDNYLWLDGLWVVSPEDHRRSVDVLISWPGNPLTELARDDMEANLVIEILTIEIKNPASRD